MIYSLPRQSRCYTVERIESAGGIERVMGAGMLIVVVE